MTVSLDNSTSSTVSTPFPCPASNGCVRRHSITDASKPPIVTSNASRRSASERPTPGPRSSTPNRNASSPAHGPTARRSPSPRVPPSPNHRPPSPSTASRRSRSASPCIYRSNSPQLTPRSRSPSSFTRSSRLWDDLHQRSTESTRQVLQQIEEQFKKDCTFRPCINNNYRSNRNNHGTHKDAFTRLSRSNNEEVRKREERRQKEIEEQEMASCTFRPIINPSPTPSTCNRPLEERLYQEADRRVAELARRRQENVLKEVGNLFHPQIDALSRQTAEAEGRIPIHQRVTEMQRQKQLHIHQLRMEEASKEATFKPQINQTSRQIVEMQVAENNQNPDRASPASTTSSSTSTTATTPKCTFRPQLSKTTERIIRQHAAFRSKDFAERQHIYAERAKAKIEYAHSQADEKIESLFQPRITPTSEILVQAKRDIENEVSKVTRLAVVDKEKSEELKQSLRDQYYSQFQFKPQLNKISQSIAKSGAAAAASRAMSKAQEELLIQLEEDFKKNCTFKPNITQAGKTHPGNIQCSHDQMADRARKLAEAQREQQYEELKTCTFQPCIGPKPPDFNRKQIDVPGIEKHKERLQQAKKLEQERKDREEQIFITNVKDTPTRYTIPKPFKLHTEYHCESKRQRREANLRQHMDKECTFEPSTNAKQAYDILRKYLLNDVDEDEEDEESNNSNESK